MLKAIVYKSNTGYTENYAKMLSEKLNIPYRLNSTPDMDKQKCAQLEKKLKQLLNIS